MGFQVLCPDISHEPSEPMLFLRLKLFPDSHPSKVLRVLVTHCQQVTNRLPTDGRLLVNCWPTVDRLLAVCRPMVSQLLADSWLTVSLGTVLHFYRWFYSVKRMVRKKKTQMLCKCPCSANRHWVFDEVWFGIQIDILRSSGILVCKNLLIVNYKHWCDGWTVKAFKFWI